MARGAQATRGARGPLGLGLGLAEPNPNPYPNPNPNPYLVRVTLTLTPTRTLTLTPTLALSLSRQLEELEGRGAWREARYSPYYDAPLVTRAIGTLRRQIAEAEASRCPAQLSQLLLSLVNRGFANIGNPHNFCHPAHGAPRAIEDLVREVAALPCLTPQGRASRGAAPRESP